MKYIIIEDEALAAERLQEQISTLKPSWELESVISSVEKAMIVLPKAEAQLAFVDIHLSDGISFQVFEQIEINIPLIFTTAYDQYALKAFELNSIDYLLKPVNRDDLKRALTKLEHRQGGMDINWNDLMQSIKPSFKTRFMVSTGERVKTINCDDIAFFHASGKHCFITDHQGVEYLIDHSLKDLITKLDPKQFFQINRQFIINLSAIQEMIPWSKSRLKLITKPSTPEEAVVSVERSPKFKAWLEGE